MEKLNILVSRNYTIEQCKINFDKLFIFGDSLERSGMGGQAIIREQINAIGICTKRKPSNEEDAFFSDKDYAKNCQIIDEDILTIKKYAEQVGTKTLVFPKMGLGTGRAQMPQRCPKTFLYLCTKLLETWGYNNIEFLQSKPM